MTRARNITPRQTAARAERLRTLVTALLAGDLERSEIGEVLQLGPSGVRKYLAELGAKIEIARRVDATEKFEGFPVYRLAITVDEARAYLASLAGDLPSRPAKQSMSALMVAARDPRRHFHILEDDVHYMVRLSRTPPMRDPLVAAFFGAGRHEVWA
ncbi:MULTISPECIES: hypothetical protein [unclassified Massilia]|uniref:hypothetical protein n=1 Tax=unclassified Massilia TaxID=2609279 RepID=UPI001785C944|nr:MULTISPECIES: hypothetical protein [unclassified Massilia]MBD8531534.1 hypothetical protein [Massilia sp. CFBP 13647]MBD8673670.1 hypothetical protein [Massilia sp. CFBP 13721]